MSYDFLLVQTSKPIRYLKDLNGEVIKRCADWSIVMDKISAIYPEIFWRTEDDAHFGDGLALNIGRFEMYIDLKVAEESTIDLPYAIIIIWGSYHVDQLEVIKSLASVLDYQVIDIQKDEVIFNQREYSY